MSRTGIARTRHLRHRRFDRTERSDTPRDFWANEASDLTGTGAAVAFTATNATNQLTAAAHGYSDGDGPFILANAGGALPAGLTATDRYWVIVVDANTIQLSLSRLGAISGAVVPFSDDGTGTHSIAKAAETAQDIYEINRQGVKPETIAAETDVDNL